MIKSSSGSERAERKGRTKKGPSERAFVYEAQKRINEWWESVLCACAEALIKGANLWCKQKGCLCVSLDELGGRGQIHNGGGGGRRNIVHCTAAAGSIETRGGDQSTLTPPAVKNERTSEFALAKLNMW